jgi:hypothetical protein
MFDKLDGLWIPKEILLNKDLKLQEKLVLSSIQNLSGDGECYASNQYFAELMDLSKKRIEVIMKSLDDAGYISRRVTYKENSKQIDKRYIKPVYPTHTSDRTLPKDMSVPYPYKVGSNNKGDNKDNIKDPIPLHFSDSQKECDNFSQDLNGSIGKDKKTAKHEKPLFIDQLSEIDYKYCQAAMITLKWMKLDEGFWNIYLGSQKKEVWNSCEEKLEEIYQCNEYYDEISNPQQLTDRLLWNIYTDRKLYEKDAEIGLPFLIDHETKTMNADVMAGCDYLDFLREI